MTTAPATPATAPEKKRSVLTRQQARFVEDALEDLSTYGTFETTPRKELLAQLNKRCEPKGFQITMANLVAAAETLSIVLPGSRDADAERDRELLEQLAITMDKLLDGSDARAALHPEYIADAAASWKAFRAGPLFAGKGETQG